MNEPDKNVYRVFNEEDLKDHDAIAAVIRNSEGKYLMLQHKKYNFWTFPIGKVKVGQSVEEALKEEVHEECDINVIKFKEVWCFSKKYERKNYLITIKTHIFEVLVYNGKGINMEPDKHSMLKWFTIEEIRNLEMISDSTKEYLDILEQRASHKRLNMVYTAWRGVVYYEDLFSDISRNFKAMTEEEVRKEEEYQNSCQDDSDVLVFEYVYDTDTIEMHRKHGRYERHIVAHRDGSYREKTQSSLNHSYDSGDIRWRKKNYK